VARRRGGGRVKGVVGAGETEQNVCVPKQERVHKELQKVFGV
jgi:hypothetical protein